MILLICLVDVAAAEVLEVVEEVAVVDVLEVVGRSVRS